MSAARFLDLRLNTKPFVFETELSMETAVEEACKEAIEGFMGSLCEFRGVSMTNQELDDVNVSFRFRSNSFLPELIKKARLIDTAEFQLYIDNEKQRVEALNRALEERKQRDSSPTRASVYVAK
jgi:hypothetical protein